MKTKDMTTGNPAELILRFAVPLFVGNIFQQIYNVVDTMVAGYNLGDGAIAAIGATSSLYAVLIDLAWGMNSGFGIVISRAFGSKNEQELKKAIASSVVLNTIITVAISVLSLLLLKPLLHGLNVPESIFDDAYIYIAIIIAGMLGTILYNMCAGILRAVGNSQTPLYFLIFSCGLNLSMDCLFIIGLHWGVEGAALATVIAQGTSAVLSGAYLLRRYKELLPGREDFVFDRELLTEMLSTGCSMAAMLSVVNVGSVLYQRAINGLGDTLIVAHTAARKIISLMMLPLSSIASANSTFVGQNKGAGRMDRIKDALKQVMLMEIGWGVFACIVVWLFGGTAIHLLTNTSDPEVLSNAVLSVRIHFLFYPALGVLLALRTALQAMGEKVVPVVSSGFELGGKILAGFVLIPMYGFLCVCFTEPIIWLVCMIFLAVIYVRRYLRN